METCGGITSSSKPDSDEEIRKLKLENAKLSRELRMTKSFLEKVERTVEAKDALGAVLAAANAKQKAYTDMLLENTPDIIFLLDDDGRFVLCTKAFLKAIGAPNFDFIEGRVYNDVFLPLISTELLEKFSAAVKQVTFQKETVVLYENVDFGKGGNVRYYAMELTIVEGPVGGNAGITSGVLAVFTDLTDIMREKERSEIANNAKSDFLAAMSHEIRTPMNAILGMTEIVSRGELNPQQYKYVSDIKKSSQALLSIINDILDFSKIEAGKMEIVEGFYSLSELLTNILDIFEPSASAKNLEFRRVIPENLPDTVYGDENRLRQILANLLSNAFKYTQSGSVEFRVRASAEKLRFDVSDTGLGIKEGDIEKLFTPFEQLDLRKNKNIAGTGLGLAISHRLCKMMGGDMWVESGYGKGSTFSLEVPCVSAEADVAAKTEKPEITQFSAKEARVLVVDDIDINLTVAEAMLQIFGIPPDLAQSGQEALRFTAENSYDIIFMDHMMPEMDGIEAMKLIRTQRGEYGVVPMIALTANVMNSAEAMLLENGFDDFLAKPLELDALNLCLKKWLPAKLVVDAAK